MKIDTELFGAFWTAIFDGVGASVQVASCIDANNNLVPVNKVSLPQNTPWPGEEAITQILVRPVYEAALAEILNGLQNHPKFFYVISGSSGMGKSEFIGYLIERLIAQNPNLRPVIRFHHSPFETEDLWLYFDQNNNPAVVASASNPLGPHLLPDYYISDTYAVVKSLSSRLHLHVVSLKSNSMDFNEYVSGKPHGTKVFPPFTQSEHLWCMGNWVTLAQYRAAMTAAANDESNHLLPGPPPPAGDVAYVAFARNEARVRQPYITMYDKKYAAAVTACRNAGGDYTVGVWSDWEELQLTFDVFGGCMRLLRLPEDLFGNKSAIDKAKTLLDEFFDGFVDSRGKPICDFDKVLLSCAETLQLEITRIYQAHCDKTIESVVVSGMARSLFEHAYSDPTQPRRVLYQPASKFMLWYIAKATEAGNDSFQQLLKNQTGQAGPGYVFDKA